MAENPVLDIFFSAFELVKGAFLVSLPVFAFVFIAIFVRRALAKKYKWNWFKSSIITTYFLVFSIVSVLYFGPITDAVLTPQIVLQVFLMLFMIVISTIAAGIFFAVVLRILGKKNVFTGLELKKIFLPVFLIIFALNFIQLLGIFNQAAFGTIFPEFQPTILEQFVPIVVQFARLLVIAILLTFIIMPIEFVGLFLFEKISERTKTAFSIRLFASVFIVTAIVSTVMLFIVPWSVSGILFLIYFGFE